MTSLYLAATPWILGICLVYVLFSEERINKWRFSDHLIAVGSSQYGGWLMMLLALALAHQLNLDLNEFLTVMACLSFVVIILAIWVRRQLILDTHRAFIEKTHEPNSRSHSLSSSSAKTVLNVFILAWLVIVVTFVIFEVALRPATSWDTVWYWSYHTTNWLQEYYSGPGNKSLIMGSSHPPPIHLIHLWSALVHINSGAEYLLYAPWLSSYLALLLGLLGLGIKLVKNSTTALAVVLWLAALPVLEAQIALAGYADHWIAFALVSTIGLVVLNRNQPRDPSKLITLVTIAIIFSISLLKSEGILYSAVALSGFLYTRCHKTKATCLKTKISIGIIMILALIGLAYVFTVGFDISLVNARLAYLPDEQIIVMNQETVRLSKFPELAIMNTTLELIYLTFTRNQTYPFVAIIFVLTISTLIKQAFTRGLHNREYVLILTVGSFFILMTAPVFSPALLQASALGSDTSYSRISIVPIILLVVTSVFLYSRKP